MIAGLILLGIGCLFLLRNLDLMFFPHWLFSFPVILIAIGAILGSRKGFNRPAPHILMFIGSILLFNDIFDNSRLTWPLAIIGIGLWIIFKPSLYSKEKRTEGWDKRVDPAEPLSTDNDSYFSNNTQETSQDWLDSMSIFGGVKKNIVSQNFKGGDVVNIFGGSELNLTQADFKGVIKLEVTQVFGGTKIIVPANWTIHSEMTAIFGGIEDKRPKLGAFNNDKILIINGTSLFGGIDIRSF